MKTETKSKTKSIEKKVLFAALDWGLGHAVRDIPLIRKLKDSNFKVTLAGSGASLMLLQQEFPDLDVFELKSGNIVYSSKRYFFLPRLIVQIPRFILQTRTERKCLKQFLEKESFDLIVSDNRYGFRHPEIPCIFITHQIFPKATGVLRFFEPFIARIHKKLIEKYSLCLIPDFKGDVNFSGDLSHRKSLSDRYRFIGILSDFEPADEIKAFSRDLLFIASGPEPQRRIFINEIYRQIKQSGMPALIVTGEPQHAKEITEGGITIVNHLERERMRNEILKSTYIITQSGYTSIMDLVKLKKKAILIPTPGQPEQEYLARMLREGSCFIIEQRDTFILKDSIDKLDKLEAKFPDIENLPHANFMDIIHEIVSIERS